MEVSGLVRDAAQNIDYCIYFLFSQLLPLLASALEFGSAAASALTALLKMGSWLSAEEFNVKVSYNFILSCQ